MQTEPSGKCYYPVPSLRSSTQSPSYLVPSLRILIPLPDAFPLIQCPSQKSPLVWVNFPKPLARLFYQFPSYIVPSGQICTPYPSLEFPFHFPQQLTPSFEISMGQFYITGSMFTTLSVIGSFRDRRDSFVTYSKITSISYLWLTSPDGFPGKCYTAGPVCYTQAMWLIQNYSFPRWWLQIALHSPPILLIFNIHQYTPMISSPLCRLHFSLIKFKHIKRPNVKITIASVLSRTLDRQLTKNDKLFMVGEIQFPEGSGGTQLVQDMARKHGQNRVWQAPITPAANAGLSIGAAFMGLRPITHFTSFNSSLQAIDHLVNSSAKLRYMSGGILTAPVIFRSVNGPVEGHAGSNSQCLAAWYGSIPGLITLAPYDAEDYQGLLRTAIRGQDPVVFLQTSRPQEEFQVDQQVLDDDFSIPFGQAKLMRRGRHVTVVAFSSGVKLAIDAADKLKEKGIECQIINLRSIKPLDFRTIAQSVKKTSRIVTVENGYPSFGVGAQISASIFQTSFKYLDAPLVRVTARDVPLPYSTNLQKLVLPQVEDVVRAVQKVVKGVKIS